MSVCTILAADGILPKVIPEKTYPIYVNVDKKIVDDGGADDNYFLYPFEDVRSYSERQYGVSLEWEYFTEGRGIQIIDYIRNVLLHTDCVELWHIWLSDYWEYDERPIIHKEQKSVDELVAEDIKKIDDAVIWDKEGKRPHFYCLKITK